MKLPLLLLIPILCMLALNGHAQPSPDCTINDICATAMQLPVILPDQPYVCYPGCNLYAAPESFDNPCGTGDFPTVWYQLSFDPEVTVLNIALSSSFETPAFTLYESSTNCDNIIVKHLTASNLECIEGSNGEAEALGTEVDTGKTYFLAITSVNSIGGDFQLCLNAVSNKSSCVLDRNIEVVARSNPGPLEGPFDPKETISICMNVNSYTAVGNGCQWFQGIVPVFGNGWDPSSFDSLGQPMIATVNGNPIGEASNGLYGASTWDWFDSVGYHHLNPALTIMDLDGNGRLDMCNSAYEMDCPVVGVTPGCCGPCWEDPGDILPPGWFAYGINGTCATPGPPVGVDWGDGNTCGGGMGPWKFCFDLITRDIPDCALDSTRRDLSLGFFTFADGETGAWVGSGSVCALDHPVRLSLQAKCGRISYATPEILPSIYSGDTLRYVIHDDSVFSWEWNLSPFSAIPYLQNHGLNGFQLEAPIMNETGEPIEARGIFIGSVPGSNDLVIKKISFTINSGPDTNKVSTHPNLVNQRQIKIYPTPSHDKAMMEWKFDLVSSATIEIINTQGVVVREYNVPSGITRFELDSEGLSAGIYLVSFHNRDFNTITRLVKL
ncbi:MAG TPA: T9SS type A sorting domain-containing protein [Saprospiraceae bacterium]|nr:T9SS type A sorting domain-containing protein [Saprospiraceae bacterium]